MEQVKKPFLKYGIWALAAVAVCASVAAGVQAVRERHEQKVRATNLAVTSLQQDFNRVLKGAFDAEGNPQPIDAKIDTKPAASGDMGEVERFVKTFMNNMIATRNAYFAEMDQAGWNKLLDPDRLRSDPSLAEGRDILSKGKDIVQKYKKKNYELLDGMRAGIAALNMSESGKREMENGLDKGLERNRRHMDALWDMEEKSVQQIENMVDLLSRIKGHWSIQNGNIAFSRQKDLDAFNGHMAQLDRLAKEQKALQENKMQAGISRLEQLKMDAK